MNEDYSSSDDKERAVIELCTDVHSELCTTEAAAVVLALLY